AWARPTPRMLTLSIPSAEATIALTFVVPMSTPTTMRSFIDSTSCFWMPQAGRKQPYPSVQPLTCCLLVCNYLTVKTEVNQIEPNVRLREDRFFPEGPQHLKFFRVLAVSQANRNSIPPGNWSRVQPNIIF